MYVFVYVSCLFATGNFQRVAGDLGGISSSSVCRIVKRVSRAIASLRPNYIRMPDAAEAQRLKQQFYDIAGFPGVIGCIECTHIPLKYPINALHPLAYTNRKGFYSYIVQMICDASMKIRNVVARWPGSSHDSRIFRNSQVLNYLQEK